MDMDLDAFQEQLPHQSMRVSPRLVAANHILQLSTMELQQAISAELSDNPALEMIEIPTCPTCGSQLQGSICPQCLRRQKADNELLDGPDANDEAFYSQSLRSSEEEFDPITQVAAEISLQERLISDMRSLVPGNLLHVAEYLVGNLDENGYLACTVEEAAYECSAEEPEVELVLNLLQTLEPAGVGARNLRECLIIQMDFLESLGIIHPFVREIISTHLTELGEHKFSKIAQDLRISSEVVADVWDFIKKELNPHPASEFLSNSQHDGRDARSSYVLPDVIISERDGQFEVEVVESKRFLLRVSPVYSRISADLERDGERYSDDERRHIQQYMARAKLFIANINQRRQTIHRITQCLVECQRDFLSLGVRHLKALTRAAVASRLGIHESTVSRATASKYVMIPSGEVVPFSTFFTASLSVKDVIEELIEKEKAPLTDAEIAERLSQRGIHVARRTVAKYRMQLRILPSSLR
ncbi:MAG TPA: RNA polymerase factor sigma-54 [Chloroflexota bacterium]|nr:RNA polymerase factor sigma-54 [Chloroflexota bacterium]